MEWYDTVAEWLKPLAEGKLDAPFALGGSVAGLGGVVGGIADYVKQQKQKKQYMSAANAPVNWQQFYNPMSTDYQRILRNSTAAELAARGLPADSMATTSAISDILAGKNNELMTKAMELGVQAKNSQLQGLYGANQQNPSYAAILGSIGKFMQPLSAYAQNQKALAARKALEDKYMSGPGQSVNTNFKFGINPPQPARFYEEGVPSLQLNKSGLNMDFWNNLPEEQQ
jgi:hypothetical protein